MAFYDLPEGIDYVSEDIGIQIELTDGTKIFVATHPRPHLDELCAMWLLKKYATAEFVRHYSIDGVIRLGIGHGVFDEHLPNGKRIEGECCATLVAKALGVYSDPCLKRLLRYVAHRDAHAGAHPMELEALVKTLHRVKNTIEINWVVEILEALYEEQMIFLTEGRKAFNSPSTLIKEIQGPRGKLLKLVLIYSEGELGELASKYARAEIGGNAGVVIQVMPETGHIAIFSSKRHGVNLIEVVQILRYKEQEVKGQIIVTDWRELSVMGLNPAIKEWYLLSKEVLLNGSLNISVPPTKIPLPQIIEAVEIAINPRAFYKEYEDKCRTGWCFSSREHPCPWYPWHLARCREARKRKFEKIKNKSAEE